ncbi:MAG: Xaa-Pro peptidase family protein [Candidatus Omnitrophota bacterium]|jgi:Xaa-Pro aminopeptidase
MMAGSDINNRIALLNKEAAKRRLDGFLVTNQANASYLSGFLGHDAIIIAGSKRNFFITDSRYIEESRKNIKGFDIRLVKTSTYDTIEEIVREGRFKRIGFESSNLPYEVALRLKGYIGKSALVPVKGLVESLRAIKDEGEISLIKKSVSLAKEVFEYAAGYIKPGISEESISKRIEIEFIRRGARNAFDAIVAGGANSSMPHARPGKLVFKKNDFVMIDMGCNLNGYCSDITRMVMIGKADARFRKIYAIVCEAHDMAIEMIKPGVRIAEVDRRARTHIQSRGFGKCFGHSLGHGVGMDVHEEPSISRTSEELLRPGMVFTIEPAIYIPGFGGVRIEDMVLVTKNGCAVLS